MSTLTGVSYGVFGETRKNAMVAGLRRLQRDEGSFAYDTSAPASFRGEVACTAQAILTLNSLHSLNAINLNNSIEYLINFTDYKETYYPSLVAEVLETANTSDRINKTMFIELVLKGHNSTSGGFFEPTRLNDAGKEEAYSYFPIGFRLVSPQFAYQNDNLINTYLAISILDRLGALDTVNVTKTAEWVLKCETTSGGFKPFPNCTYRGTIFDVDLNCSGIAFTFCAVETLRMLDHLDQVDKSRIRDYVLSCYDGGLFYNRQHPAGSSYVETGGNYNWWAIKTLADIGALNPNESKILSVVQRILDDQYLHASGWPVPTDLEEDYGLIGRLYGDDPMSGTYYSTMMLSEVNSSLLDDLTPRAVTFRNNIFTITVISLLVLAGVLFIAKTWQDFNKRARKLATEQKSKREGNEDIVD